MCGIVGYTGQGQALPVLLNGLQRLEYRGYDSAGVALTGESDLGVKKRQGKLACLRQELEGLSLSATCGIGHTRWATHGEPSDQNSHPHTDCQGRIAVVHNGIIENYQELREELVQRGHRLASETDSEVIAHLLEEQYQGDLLRALQAVLPRLEGSYALAVVCSAEPHRLVGARKDSPLVVGLGQGETLLASDIPALLEYTRSIITMEDGEVVDLTPQGATVYGPDGQLITRQPQYITWDLNAAEKGGYPHFMLKEIYEQPRALRDTMAGRLNGGSVYLEDVHLTHNAVRDLHKVVVVACGTAYHAGLVGRWLLEHLVRLPVEVDLASEFRYREPLVDNHTLVVVVSQSGETADTLAALREARARGARVLAITNVVGSSVAREADDLIYTQAGPEIAVASTKAYTTQLLAFYLLALYLGCSRGTLAAATCQELSHHFHLLPEKVEQVLELAPQVEEWAACLGQREDAFYIGRGLDYALALEGALKLKEISYIHAEAYAAGELKHGTLALIEEGMPVIALATQPQLVEKMVSNIKEIKARGGVVTGLTLPGQASVARAVDTTLYLPQLNPLTAPVVAVVPLQLLAYYGAVGRGCDVDQPRNLAKSVTVE